MDAQLIRSERSTVRLRQHERELIERAAQSEKSTLSEWIRATLTREARRRLRRTQPNHLTGETP